MKYALAVMLLAGPSALWAVTPDSATGLWKINGSVHGRPVDMLCNLTETNHKLSGTCSRPSDASDQHHIDGSVDGEKLQFRLQTALGSNPITLIVNGKLNPDRSHVSGNLDVEPLGVSGKFEGNREPDAGQASIGQTAAPSPSTAVSPAPSASAAPSPTGTWKVISDFQGTVAELTCSLKQDASTLAGTCTGEDGKPRPITGEVNEHSVKWHFDTEYQGQPIRVSITAALKADGATISGEAEVTPLNAFGTVTATRQPDAAPVPTAGTPPAP